MRKSKFSEQKIIAIISVGTLMVIGALWLGGVIYQTGKNRLPREVKKIDQYLARMPTPVAAYRCERDDQPYHVLVGPEASWPAIPSGPPEYVFDQYGYVVDSSKDIGDDLGYRERRRCRATVPLPVNDAVSAIRGR